MDPSDSEIIMAELPIIYSVRSALAQELLTNLPHEKYLAENENVILQFSKSTESNKILSKTIQQFYCIYAK